MTGTDEATQSRFFRDVRLHWAISENDRIRNDLTAVCRSKAYRAGRAMAAVPKSPALGVKRFIKALSGRENAPASVPVLSEPVFGDTGVEFAADHGLVAFRFSPEFSLFELHVEAADAESGDRLAVFLDPGGNDRAHVANVTRGWSVNGKGEHFRYVNARNGRVSLTLPTELSGALGLRVVGLNGNTGDTSSFRVYVTAPGVSEVRLGLHEKQSVEQVLAQLGGKDPRLLVTGTDGSSLRLFAHHPATEATEIIVPWLGDSRPEGHAVMLQVTSVRVDGTNTAKESTDFLRSLGLSYSRRAGWYQYCRSTGHGAVSFHLKAVPVDLEIEATVQPWRSEQFLTDLTQIRLVRHRPSTPTVEPFTPSPFAGLGRARMVRNLRVAAIADPMTASALTQTAEVRFLDRRRAQDQLADWTPDLLFVESAWRGNRDQWRYGIGQYAGGSNADLFRLVHGARQLGVPSVFWNKEDPIHFQKFAAAASAFDHVFTTDRDCIPAYREAFKGLSTGQSVDTLPFFVLPDVHNPFYRPTPRNGVCFAGSYYGDRHPERSRIQDAMLDAFREAGLDIYDRNHASPGSPYVYPDRFSPHILGGVSPERMPEVYKAYDWFLNVNTVTDSPTMYARRVPELLACGTGVITNPSRGIRDTFGAGVREWSDEATSELVALMRGGSEPYDRLRGAMDVMYSQSFESRLAELAANVTNTPCETGWREFVLVLVGSAMTQGPVREALGRLEREGVAPEVVVVLGEGDSPPEGLEAMEGVVTAPLVYLPGSAADMLDNLAERDRSIVLAAAPDRITPENLKSLLCTNRVIPATITGLSRARLENTVGLAATLFAGCGGELHGPWLFRPGGISTAMGLVSAGRLAASETITAPNLGLTWSVAPDLSLEREQ